MPTQVRTTKKPKKKTEEELRPEMEQLAAEDAARGERPPVDLEDLDEFLDEVDALLEENAEQFVANYRQQGGQ